MHKKELHTAGKDLEKAKKVLVLLHGRGSTAEDILGLKSRLPLEDFALIAPQATNQTWYPYSFLAPVKENEPWLSSALDLLGDIVEDLMEKGFDSRDIYFLGFSQGACLCLEFATRNARKYGGITAFTGGLIGESLEAENYSGDFEETPVFIGTGDPDSHVPVGRVKRTAEILNNMNADVSVKIYENRPHTISENELELARDLIFN
ncbi:alpha/beta hydrolase [Salegentibacter sediminis]|uniref:alpha/beta hydrolase n=1 Tax=Salegentibacter sediminis TaxID=1930251 RepID=UPI0009C18BA9|nr:dienelactone hydrolase family protein [Salegentibacter sediminis]